MKGATAEYLLPQPESPDVDSFVLNPDTVEDPVHGDYRTAMRIRSTKYDFSEYRFQYMKLYRKFTHFLKTSGQSVATCSPNI